MPETSFVIEVADFLMTEPFLERKLLVVADLGGEEGVEVWLEVWLTDLISGEIILSSTVEDKISLLKAFPRSDIPVIT